MIRKVLVAGAIAALALAAFLFLGPQHKGDHQGDQPYAGLQDRGIASLSEQDIAQLRSGGGWGLALPAELSGLPGPKHVLELRDELDLTPQQIAEVEAIYEQVQAEAIEIGLRFIDAEAAITQIFRQGDVDPEALKRALETAEGLRSDLRFAHLSRHQQTADLLTPEQIEAYNIARGYADDPCANVPEGHNASLWREHNGCT